MPASRTPSHRGRAMLEISHTHTLAAVSTVLTPAERIRVDAAGEGSYQALHRDNVDDVVKDLKANRAAAVVVSVRAFSQFLGVLPSTLMSRFFRAGLPAPKRYLAVARLVRAARLFENPGFSVANIANHLDYSSPQSFGRHIRTVLGMTAVQFRRHYDGASMLQHFRESLVLPHADALRRLKPLTATARPFQEAMLRGPTPVARSVSR